MLRMFSTFGNRAWCTGPRQHAAPSGLDSACFPDQACRNLSRTPTAAARSLSVDWRFSDMHSDPFRSALFDDREDSNSSVFNG